MDSFRFKMSFLMYSFPDSIPIETLTHFINEGWQGGAQADAALKSEDKGEAIATAIDVAPGIRLYQLTESGIALQATVQGTKYWKDDELN